jgi:hypothetical protein
LSGGWKRQLYEVSSADQPPNGNWFPIAEFVTRVKAPEGSE